MKKRCGMCGKFVIQTQSHHTLPIWLGGEDKDILEVCPRCHSRADRWLTEFIVRGGENSNGKYYRDPKKVKRIHDRLWGFSFFIISLPECSLTLKARGYIDNDKCSFDILTPYHKQKAKYLLPFSA